MGKITINEMHNSLFDYAQAVSDENLMTENKTIVDAINEIYGKRLIADSIGEPLNNTDTFTKMSDDINNLLSTFKTNMMNNGIAVESGDKFKQLIDKIKELTEGEGNKGIQFAEGTITTDISHTFTGTTGNLNVKFDNPLEFTPTYIVLCDVYLRHCAITTNFVTNLSNINASEAGTNTSIILTGLSSTGFNISYTGVDPYESLNITCSFYNPKYIAIEVGEEDTTLRDLLASILQDKGVEVTEEDTMIDLINKVATLDDDEGIQFAEGVINTISDSTKTFTATKIIGGSAGAEDLYYNTIELDFEPYILFTETIVESYYLESLKATFVINNFYNSFSDELTISHIAQYQESLYKAYYNLEREGNVYYNPIINALTTGVNDYVIKETKYYAIGLGEKDNTICDDDKGLRFAEGVCDNITIGVNTATNWHEYIFEQDFGFIPSRIMFQSESTKLFALNRDTRIVIDSHYHYSEDKCWYMTAYNSAQGLDNYRMYISNISSTGFSLFIKSDSSCFFNSNTWYAIGVGEEDTTLRDSLADILEDEGVEITEEDDMASLITKVDEEFDKLNSSKNIVQIETTAGGANTFIVKNDGSLWVSGYNNYGELGLGHEETVRTLTQVTTNINNDVKEVSCGAVTAMLVKNDGTLWACGKNSYSSLAIPDVSETATFIQVPGIDNVKHILCGYYFALAIKNDGSLWGCGANGQGQLGLGDTRGRSTFTQVTTNINYDVKDFYCTNTNNENTVFIVKNDGSVWACGYNNYGSLGTGGTDNKNVFTQII